MTPSTPAPTSVGSSKLFSMKFMQRAAASSPTTPESEPSAKRRKASNGRALAATPPPIDRDVVSAAVAEVEAKRQAALQKQVADEHWVLDVPAPPRADAGEVDGPEPLRVEYVSRAWVYCADPDQDPKSFRYDARNGRFQTKDYKRKEESESDGSDEEDSEDSEEDGDSEDDNPPKRTKKKAPRDAAGPKGTPASSGKKNGIKLSQLASISGSGSKLMAPPKTRASGSGTPGKGCYACGEPGHIARACPKKSHTPRGPSGQKRRHSEV